MTHETDTNPTPTEPPAFALCSVADIMRVLDVAAEALAGDGSTDYMPDVRPIDAARWMLAGLDDAGFVIVKRAQS